MNGWTKEFNYYQQKVVWTLVEHHKKKAHGVPLIYLSIHVLLVQLQPSSYLYYYYYYYYVIYFMSIAIVQGARI